jgi:hypothetical protein
MRNEPAETKQKEITIVPCVNVGPNEDPVFSVVVPVDPEQTKKFNEGLLLSGGRHPAQKTKKNGDLVIPLFIWKDQLRGIDVRTIGLNQQSLEFKHLPFDRETYDLMKASLAEFVKNNW